MLRDGRIDLCLNVELENGTCDICLQLTNLCDVVTNACCIAF